MRSIPFKTEQETYEEQRQAGRYNPGLVLIYTDTNRRKQRVPLSAGYEDYIYVYREGEEIFALSLNHRLGYVGLEVFSGDPAEHVGEIFLQNDWEIEDVLGRKGLDLSPPTIVRRLAQYLY